MHLSRLPCWLACLLLDKEPFDQHFQWSCLRFLQCSLQFTVMNATLWSRGKLIKSILSFSLSIITTVAWFLQLFWWGGAWEQRTFRDLKCNSKLLRLSAPTSLASACLSRSWRPHLFSVHAPLRFCDFAWGITSVIAYESEFILSNSVNPENKRDLDSQEFSGLRT